MVATFAWPWALTLSASEASRAPEADSPVVTLTGSPSVAGRFARLPRVATEAASAILQDQNSEEDAESAGVGLSPASFGVLASSADSYPLIPAVHLLKSPLAPTRRLSTRLCRMQC